MFCANDGVYYINDVMLEFLEANNVMIGGQHGFTKGSWWLTILVTLLTETIYRLIVNTYFPDWWRWRLLLGFFQGINESFKRRQRFWWLRGMFWLPLITCRNLSIYPESLNVYTWYMYNIYPSVIIHVSKHRFK